MYLERVSLEDSERVERRCCDQDKSNSPTKHGVDSKLAAQFQTILSRGLTTMKYDLDFLVTCNRGLQNAVHRCRARFHGRPKKDADSAALYEAIEHINCVSAALQCEVHTLNERLGGLESELAKKGILSSSELNQIAQEAFKGIKKFNLS